MDAVITACQSYSSDDCRKALASALTPLGGLDWVKPGMRIAIKTNLVTAMRPDAAATTHPALLCALVELLRARGAAAIIGDSPGGLYTPAYVNLVYNAAGMGEVKHYGGVLNQDFSQKTAEFPQAVAAKVFQYTAWLDSCDGIIDFCKLKSHGMMTMSAAVKNLFGTIPGTLKPEYHFRYPDPRSFAHMLVDLAEYWKPRLTIVDAVVGMEGNGPTAGTPKQIGALIAGKCPHKVDLLCAAIVDIPRSAVPTLEAALERGLIPSSVEELAVLGELSSFVVREFKKVDTTTPLQFQSLFQGRFGSLFFPYLRRFLSSRPMLQAQECIGCAKCAGICPAKAITMKKGKPVIARPQCISCFCCQEFCPKGAMKVARPPLARLLNK